MSNNGEKQQTTQSLDPSFLYCSSFICSSIIFISLIMALITWYWRGRVISQAVSMGRPGLAMGTFLSGLPAIRVNI